MFPSKFLQFPSILTHFHAANEKIQNGGRDLAISRGLVWVNRSADDTLSSKAFLGFAVNLYNAQPLADRFNILRPEQNSHRFEDRILNVFSS